MKLYTVRTSTMHSCAINIAFHGLIQTKILGTSHFYPTHNVYAQATTDTQQEIKSLMMHAPYSLTQVLLSWVCKCCSILQSITSNDKYNVRPCKFVTDQIPPNERQPIKPSIFQLIYLKSTLSCFPPDTL
jgi:hypothetical protein